MFGGTDGDGYFRDVWRLNLAPWNNDPKQVNGYPYWEPMTEREDETSFTYYQRIRSLPAARYKHGACLRNNALYVIGGGQHVDVSQPFVNIIQAEMDALEFVPKFCLATRTWSTVQTFPCPSRAGKEFNILHGYPNMRMSMAWTVSADNRYFYMVGGQQVRRTKTNPFFAKRRPLNDVWRLEVDLLQWKFLGTVPEYSEIESGRMATWGLTFHACALSLSENYLMVFGGYKVYFIEDHKNRSTRQHNNNSLRLTIQIPTLMELAKDALRRREVPHSYSNRQTA